MKALADFSIRHGDAFRDIKEEPRGSVPDSDKLRLFFFFKRTNTEKKGHQQT